MIIILETRLEDCQQKVDFKMETLNFPLFLRTIRGYDQTIQPLNA